MEYRSALNFRAIVLARLEVDGSRYLVRLPFDEEVFIIDFDADGGYFDGEQLSKCADVLEKAGISRDRILKVSQVNLGGKTIDESLLIIIRMLQKDRP